MQSSRPRTVFAIAQARDNVSSDLVWMEGKFLTPDDTQERAQAYTLMELAALGKKSVKISSNTSGPSPVVRLYFSDGVLACTLITDARDAEGRAVPLTVIVDRVSIGDLQTGTILETVRECIDEFAASASISIPTAGRTALNNAFAELVNHRSLKKTPKVLERVCSAVRRILSRIRKIFAR